MPTARAVAKTRRRVQRRVNAAPKPPPLGPGLFGRVHVRAGITAGRSPLPDYRCSPNPLILSGAVHRDCLFEIFPEIDLLRGKLAFSVGSCQPQQRVRVLQQTQSICPILQNHLSGERLRVRFQRRRYLMFPAWLFQHLLAKCASGQSKQTRGQQDCDRFHSPCLFSALSRVN